MKRFGSKKHRHGDAPRRYTEVDHGISRPMYRYAQQRSGADRPLERRSSSLTISNQKRPSLVRRILRFFRFTFRLIKKVKWTSIPTAFATILVIVGIGALSYLSPSAQIDSGDATKFVGDREELQTWADDYMASSVLHRIKPAFDEQKFEAALRQEFPEFTGLEVRTFVLRRSAVISLQFADPTLILSTGSKLYLLSDNGTVLMDATKTQPDFPTDDLTLVQDLTEVPLEVGKPALTSQQVAYINTVAYQLAQKQVATRSIQLMPGGNELHVRVAGVEYYIKFNIFEDARQSSGAYLALREDLDRRGETPAEYVDLRIPERAYVK